MRRRHAMNNIFYIVGVVVVVAVVLGYLGLR
jgi:predicted nucleic acid-binding Zn ribbon protein